MDEDTETENYEDKGKCDVLADEESSLMFPDQEENPVVVTNDYICLQDLALRTQKSSPSASVTDICLAGPVSPPVLGEDLSKRGLHHVKLPSDKEGNSSEEKPDVCSFLNDVETLSSHTIEHNLHVSESCSSQLSSIPHSEQYEKSKSESLILPGITDSNSLSYCSGQKDTPSASTEHADNSQLYRSVKPELSSAPIIENDTRSSSPHCKQYDKQKTLASSPTIAVEGNAEISDEDRASPSLLMHQNTSLLAFSEENSGSTGTVIAQPSNININGIKSKHTSNSDYSVHTPLTRNEFNSGKFVVTKMEMKSDTDSRVVCNKSNKMIRSPRKFVRKLGVSSYGKQEHANTKSVPPDVITLE